jgi:hypothetical protein
LALYARKMKPASAERLIPLKPSVAALIYGLPAKAFPSHHRAGYGGGMIDVFRHELAGTRSTDGAWAALRFAIDAYVDAVLAGWGERRRQRLMKTQYEGNGRFVGLGLDLRHAIRGLTKSWTFTEVCLTSLAIGIAINAIIFLFAKRTFDPPPAGLTLAVPDVVVGSLLAAALVQAVLGEWYSYFDRTAIDLVQLSGGAAVALLVVLMASSMPARRAASVQPLEALRRE